MYAPPPLIKDREPHDFVPSGQYAVGATASRSMTAAEKDTLERCWRQVVADDGTVRVCNHLPGDGPHKPVLEQVITKAVSYVSNDLGVLQTRIVTSVVAELRKNNLVNE